MICSGSRKFSLLQQNKLDSSSRNFYYIKSYRKETKPLTEYMYVNKRVMKAVISCREKQRLLILSEYLQI